MPVAAPVVCSASRSAGRGAIAHPECRPRRHATRGGLPHPRYERCRRERECAHKPSAEATAGSRGRRRRRGSASVPGAKGSDNRAARKWHRRREVRTGTPPMPDPRAEVLAPEIPVDESARIARRPEDGVVGRKVVVTDDLTGSRRPDHELPVRVRRLHERRGRSMQRGNQWPHPREFVIGMGRLATSTNSSTSRPWASVPNGRGAPAKPTCCRWLRSACTVAVQYPPYA